MLKKSIYIFIVVAVIGVIAFVLFNNKQKMAATVQTKKITALPVSVLEATNETIDKKLVQVGTVFADKEVAVTSEADGLIRSVHCDVGDFVKAGQLLFKVDDEIIQATVKLREADYEKAKKDLERYVALLKDGSGTEAQVDAYRLGFKASEAQLTIAKRQLENTRVKAPFSGVVLSRMVNLGSDVNPGSVVITLVDISSLRVKVSISEADVVFLKTGDKVTVTSDIFPDQTYSARIKSIGVKGDDIHSFPVELIISNNRNLKAGMTVVAEFDRRVNRESVVIPRIALLGSSLDAKIFVVENNVAKLRKITTGIESGTSIEILSGVKPGEKIVTSGQVNLTDGDPVTIIKSK